MSKNIDKLDTNDLLKLGRIELKNFNNALKILKKSIRFELVN